MEIKLRNVCFNVNGGKNKEAWEYINSNQWEKETFDILDYFIKPHQTVLDLGCWSGVISLYLADKAKKVYAIDPDPVSIEELKKNILLNKGFESKIKPFQVAISNKKGTTKLSAREEYGLSSSSILNRKRDLETSFEVGTNTLLSFIDENKIDSVDFIKMDIEGAEFLILPTIKEALNKMDFPTLFVSFHYNYLNEKIYFEKVKSRLFTKVCLKIEQLLTINFFKQEIEATIHNLWNGIEAYNYIYTDKKELISIDFLKQNPTFIKNNNLIFTNHKWE